MAKTTIGDAYQQQKGDLRQYAEAVEICLKASEDEIVHIENYGDISTLTTTIEVKDLESSITLGSLQIWNTLKNWVVDFHKFSQFDRLLLLTTSPVVTDRSIMNWNQMSAGDKFEKLVEASNKIKGRKNASEDKIKLINQVLSFDEKYTKEDLLFLLKRFHICLSDVDSKKKYEQLLQLDVFKLHTKPNAKSILDGAISFVFKKGLEGTDKWVINISELHRMLSQLGERNKKKLPKLLKNYDSIKVDDFQGAVFVIEISKIDLDRSEIEDAIGDYCKTNDVIIDLIDENSLYADDIVDFKNEKLLKYLKGNKRLQGLEQGSSVLNSQKNYHNCLWKMGLLDLRMIENEPYFQRGAIHTLVDEEQFKWLIDEG